MFAVDVTNNADKSLFACAKINTYSSLKCDIVLHSDIKSSLGHVKMRYNLMLICEYLLISNVDVLDCQHIYLRLDIIIPGPPTQKKIINKHNYCNNTDFHRSDCLYTCVAVGNLFD